MKRFLALFIAAMMLFGLCGCGDSASDGDVSESTEPVESPAEDTEPADDGLPVSEDAAEEEFDPSSVILPDNSTDGVSVYDDFQFTYTAPEPYSKGEWEWFNTVISNFGDTNPEAEMTQLLDSLRGNDDSRLMVTITFGSGDFNASEASFDVGIQNTKDADFSIFRQVRSSDVAYYSDHTIYTVSGRAILDIYDDLGLDPNYSQLYVQFAGLTEEADAGSCEVTLDVVYPREADAVSEEAVYSEPLFSYSKSVTAGEWNWFNAILASYEGDQYTALVEAMKTEGARMRVTLDMTSEDFDEGAIFTVGFQSSEDYGLIGGSRADDIVYTDSGTVFTIGCDRINAQLDSFGINPENAQIYVQFAGVKPESSGKTCNVTVEIVVAE